MIFLGFLVIELTLLALVVLVWHPKIRIAVPSMAFEVQNHVTGEKRELPGRPIETCTLKLTHQGELKHEVSMQAALPPSLHAYGGHTWRYVSAEKGHVYTYVREG